MIFDGLSPELFRPLASKNARLYYASLQALYRRLIDNQVAGDECTPKEARQTIRSGIFEYCDEPAWAEEAEDEETPAPDLANRIYRKLRDSGWLLEIDDIGYRKITSFAYLPAQLLTAIASYQSFTGAGNWQYLPRGVYKPLCAHEPAEGISFNIVVCGKVFTAFL